MCCQTPVYILTGVFFCKGKIMEKITSRENLKIKLLCKLIKSKKARFEHNLFVAEGLRLVLDALRSNVEIQSIFVTQECIDKNSKHINEFILNDNNSFLITKELSTYISDTQNPQGIYAICKKLDKNVNIDKIYNNGVFICLCSLQDPGNVGTIIRTAEAFGIKHIIMTEDCPDIFSPKVLRSTMGSAFRINVITFEDAEKMVRTLKLNGVTTYAAVLNDKSIALGTFDFPQNSAVLIGNEANGLSESIIKMCDSALHIPMKGSAESLNAATAANIIMWEMTK